MPVALPDMRPARSVQARHLSLTPSRLLTGLSLAVIKFYRAEVSPFLPPHCRFTPSCSVYMRAALLEHPFPRAAVLCLWRLARCNPTGGWGYDPVVWPPVRYTFPQ